MSQLDELIAEFCPNGVEYKTIDEIAVDIYRGSCIKRDQVTEEGIPCVRYGEIYTTYGVWFEECKSHTKLEYVKSPKYFEHGDILFAITGESVEDIAKCCAYIGNEKCLAGGDIVVLKHKEDPKYISYALSTVDAQRQKSSGKVKSKVVHSSVPSIKAIKLPVPPLEVQREIVHILDSFTLLTAELTAELTARKKQYEFYRNKMLTFDSQEGKASEITWRTLAEIADISTGSSNTDDAIEDGVYPFYVRSQEPLKKNDYEYDEEAIITAGDGVGVGKVFHYVNGKYALHQRAYRIHPVSTKLSGRYLYHYFITKFPSYIGKQMYQGSVPSIRRPMLNSFEIAIPALEIQKKIVAVLDNFDTICTDLNIGLPAEIEARQKQYEYYRDLLLTFAEKGNTVLTDGRTDRSVELGAIKLVQYVFGYAYLTLNQISDNCDRQRKPVTKGKRTTGKYPYYGASGVVDYVSEYIFDGDYLLVSEDGANLLARSTPIAFSISGKTWVNNHAHVLKFTSYELRKYVENYLNSIDLSKYISGGAQPKLNQDNLNKITIPIPNIERVKYVVSILDRFDTLCNDLSTGLPAEIETRQKQYEYYRDKLLSFEKIQK